MNAEKKTASETLLRDVITQLCAIAGTCHPDLAGALAALDEAARDGQSDTRLRQASTTLSELTARGRQRARPEGPLTPVARAGAADGDTTTLIQGVLRNLAIPTSLESLARDIRQALDRNGGSAPKRDLVNQTLHLMAEAKAHGEQRHRELQDFLKATVGRLIQLENAVTNVQTATRSDGEELARSRKVRQAQFIQLRSITAETDDLEQLKEFIGERIDQLQGHLQQQDEAGDEKQRRLEQTLIELGTQVSQLSAETVTLRSRLDVTTEEALRDPLTGAYNRLAYERRAALEVARWRSDNGKLSMVMCDIDHFKRINDTFGHAAGDKVLKEVVRLLQEQLRSSDFVARYGGEEFVILLNGAAEDSALQIAEKLRRTVKAAPFRSRGERVPVTISCGVGTFGGEDTLEAVFDRTDAALYAAKTQGRDRCVPSVSKAA